VTQTDFAVKSDVSSMGMCEDGSETEWRWVGTEIKSTAMSGLGCNICPMQVIVSHMRKEMAPSQQYKTCTSTTMPLTPLTYWSSTYFLHFSVSICLLQSVVWCTSQASQ